MPLTSGMHHVATLTADIDRLIEFYERVFDGNVIADMSERACVMSSSVSAAASCCTRSRYRESTCRKASSPSSRAGESTTLP